MTAIIAGVGMIPFAKPGASAPYDEMGEVAIRLALDDAGIAFEDVQQAYASYVYGDSTSGQRVIYRVGMTGIPIINVNNNCSSGSTALFLARQAVESGVAECVLAVGFEQMAPGALGVVFPDRPSPLAEFDAATDRLIGDVDLPMTLRYFGGAGKAHMERFGTKMETFAKIRAKASRHAANNPLSVFRKEMTTQDIMGAQVIWPGVMTRPMACPPTCGAAAALVVSKGFAEKMGLDTTVQIRAQAMTTDKLLDPETGDMIEVVGARLSRDAARMVYEKAGVGPDDIDVIELHDCFAQNELISYEALGLCAESDGEKLVDDGDNTFGGKYVTNPSGGLLSKGHPLGATGLAQCFELTNQLRGKAENRQVDNARLALQHNVGLGGAAVVTLYERITA